MAPDELALACRLSGLSVQDLWMRYLEIGGGRSRAELASRLEGGDWPEPEDRYLSVVLDEALREMGLPTLAPLSSPPLLPLPPRVPLADLRPPSPDMGTTLLHTWSLGSRMTALIERCAHTRADARGTRRHAESVRQARHVRAGAVAARE